MSYLTNLEMSCFRNAKLPFSEGGHDGRKGHYHVKAEGVKANPHHSEGSRWGDKAGKCRRDTFIKYPANKKDRLKGTG